MSPPYDHDLNPIAERVIAVRETLTIAAKSSSGAPIGFWPYLMLYSTQDQLVAPRLLLQSHACPPTQPDTHHDDDVEQPGRSNSLSK